MSWAWQSCKITVEEQSLNYRAANWYRSKLELLALVCHERGALPYGGLSQPCE